MTQLKRVYHLLSCDYAIKDLNQCRLKVSTFTDLNDPFELLALRVGDKDQRRV